MHSTNTSKNGLTIRPKNKRRCWYSFSCYNGRKSIKGDTYVHAQITIFFIFQRYRPLKENADQEVKVSEKTVFCTQNNFSAILIKSVGNLECY